MNCMREVQSGRMPHAHKAREANALRQRTPSAICMPLLHLRRCTRLARGVYRVVSMMSGCGQSRWGEGLTKFDSRLRQLTIGAMTQGTTLPPGVPGNGGLPKGELICRVGHLKLASAQHSLPPRSKTVFVRWWGDAGPGTRLELEPGAKSDAAVSFPLCCGPRCCIFLCIFFCVSMHLHVSYASSCGPWRVRGAKALCTEGVRRTGL